MARSQPVKVLVIDDNDSIAHLLGAFLESAGYKAVIATDAFAGLDLARKERPHVVVCDSLMPRMSGRELFQRLRESPENRDVSFVLMSGAPEEYGSSGAFLAKPFTLEEALSAVRTASAQVAEPIGVR